MLESVAVTIFPVVFLTVLFGGGARLRRRNIDMDGEPPIHRRIFYVSKYAILGLWGVMVLRTWGVPLSLAYAPRWLRGVSLFLWMGGFGLLLIGRLGLAESFRIGSPKESTHLKTGGLFQFSRNPMYLGVYATILATVLYTLNPLVLLAGAFVIVVHHRIVLAEEQHLQRVFGEEYADYCRRVRRYV
ncbi:MAG: phosphatidylethanolamine N-methyltransferase family protein [Planctomycetes bacterium]|jgi:protein-S-isoprenylcysteine O-methyltransferase Ste14|nr:phosphatidylethanolamine N-methyltransferase family protein [Planctomycetota bacterium]